MWASVLSGAGDSIFPGAESAAPLYSGQGWGPTCCPQDKESTRLLFAGLHSWWPSPCSGPSNSRSCTSHRLLGFAEAILGFVARTHSLVELTGQRTLTSRWEDS
jgi:hypothetical protein